MQNLSELYLCHWLKNWAAVYYYYSHYYYHYCDDDYDNYYIKVFVHKCATILANPQIPMSYI